LSCLSRAIAFCVENAGVYSKGDTVKLPKDLNPRQYRQIIADAVIKTTAIKTTAAVGENENEKKNENSDSDSDSDMITSAVAAEGKSPEEYATWVLMDEKWGGEIEMSILAMNLKICIKAVDISTGVVYEYGKGKG